MKWCRAFKIAWRLVRADRQNEPEAASFRVQFIADYDKICRACSLFSDSPASAAETYFSTVLSQETGIEWWRRNHLALVEPWFIVRYCREHQLLPERDEPSPPVEPIVILPENASSIRRAQIGLERDMYYPEEGLLRIDSADNTALAEALQSMNFSPTAQGCLRKVGECSGSLPDRAAEAGLELLKRGYSLYLTDRDVADKIRIAQFTPVHRYWIRETSRPDILRLTYPRDKTLHQYVCAAGGRWNGKYVEFPIVCYDRLGDLIRLYDFHLTRTANQRIDAWQRATRQAVVYRVRREEEGKPRPTAEDVFQQLLAREIVVPDDLKDSE